MKSVIQRMKPAAVLIGLLIVLPAAALADKGGKPSKQSEAITAACIVDADTARACSCKELSNVVLQCGNVFIKHDDLEAELGEEVFVGDFDCVDAEGALIDGPINIVAVKSGSQKNANSDAPTVGAPSGSGVFFQPDACDVTFTCPTPGDCEVAAAAEEPTEQPQ